MPAYDKPGQKRNEARLSPWGTAGYLSHILTATTSESLDHITNLRGDISIDASLIAVVHTYWTMWSGRVTPQGSHMQQRQQNSSHMRQLGCPSEILRDRKHTHTHSH